MQNQMDLSSLWWTQPGLAWWMATTPHPSHSRLFTITATSCFSSFTIRQFPWAPIFRIPGRIFNTHRYSLPPFGCPPSFERCKLTPLFYSPPPFFFPSFLLKQQAKERTLAVWPIVISPFYMQVPQGIHPGLSPTSYAKQLVMTLRAQKLHSIPHHMRGFIPDAPIDDPPPDSAAVYRPQQENDCSFHTYLWLRWFLPPT